MTCGVAISSSPVFSPSSSFFCKSTPEALVLTHSPSSASSSCPSPSSPAARPRRLQPSGLVVWSGAKESSFSSSVPAASTSPTYFKRKRPTRLDIPNNFSINFSSNPAPETPAAAEAVEVEEYEYAVRCKKGRRESMEDRYSSVLTYNGDPKRALFGVFDGHGGSKAAQFAAEFLGKNIMYEVDNCKEEDEIEEAVKRGYLKTDSEFLKQEVRGGACCVTALIRKGKLVVSNAGDCRAVVSRGGVAEALTSDHRPSREDEKKRIEALGGYVDDCRDVWRIQGSLAVSRSIGDRYLKQWVTAEPETRILGLEPDLEFLILASDGLWDKVGNQEAVDIARSLCVGVDKPQLLSACKQLIELSASRGSADDTSVMLIQLARFF